MRPARIPSGVIVYRGPSMLDGAPVVVVATTKTSNRKTGDMSQVWILRDDVSPVDAIRTGQDASICGQCPHRGRLATGGNSTRTCYVNVGQAPLSVWRAMRRGVYADGPLPMHKPVRLGAYGDPAAVPFEVWSALLAEGAPKHTGYTHQWRTCDQQLKGLLMASCDSAGDAMEAARMGWRSFIVMPATFDPVADPLLTLGGEAPKARTIQCLSDRNGLECAKCGVCDGTKVSVWIHAHGSAAAFVGMGAK